MRRREPAESPGVLLTLTVIHLGVVLLYLRELATWAGLGAALTGVTLAVAASRFAYRRYLRLPLALLIAAAVALGALPLSDRVLAGGWGPNAQATLLLADAVFGGLLAFGVVFGLRFLASRVRALAVLEAGYVVGAVSYMFIAHRNQMLSRPRWLSDWAWSRGLDPQVLLQGFGVAVAVVAVVVLLRRQRASKLVISALALILVAGLVYLRAKDVRNHPDINTNGLALDDDSTKGGDHRKDDRSDKKGKKGKKGKGGGGSGDGEASSGKGGGGGASGRSSRPPPPLPVAVAVFHESYDPPNGLLYFRQQVLSKFDGHHLVADTSGRYDADVFDAFPQGEELRAPPVLNPDFHHRVPISMFLLADHPQPVALSGAIRLAPLENPAPRRFVAAYDVTSLVLSAPTVRLSGRRSVPAEWDAETRAHYLAHPDDPRYDALGEEILRDLDPRFAGDDLMRAMAIKRWLEHEGFYTRKERHLGEDPAASFLFGSRRGYCVHFAHAAADLFRSQGIASRVALGYAVDNRMRGAGSSVLILGDRAHAWPEIYIEGVGWITFDIYPERSDEPPPRLVEQSMESLLGELARGDASGGRATEVSDPFEIPWAALLRWLSFLLGGALGLAYVTKVGRRLVAVVAPNPRWQYLAVLDRLSDVALQRQRGESRERHARRLAEVAPSMGALTHLHLRLALGAPGSGPVGELRGLCQRVRAEAAAHLPWWRRLLGWANPVGWWFTR